MSKQETNKIAIFADAEYHQRICEMDDFTIGMGPISKQPTGTFGNRPTGTFGHEADADRREGNARLIAAAPDLLAACKAMALVAVWGRSHALLAQANEAIQKAEAGQ